MYEATLILVRDGGAGKTTLLHRLQGRSEATERTRGVEIEQHSDIADPEMIRDLARYFHDLGIALWYHKIPQLADKIILQPEWVTDAVYKVVDDQQVQDNKGHFDHADLSRLWEEDTYQGMQHQLIELMKAFRLCYQKRGREQYIIPALLIQEEATEFWTPERCLQVEYDYVFLPKGIMNQLTAELHQDIKADEAVWSRGVVLETELAEARVVEDWYKRKVSIEVKGASARGLLQIIMRELEAINDTYAGMKVTKMVPCICGYCQEAEEVKRFKYDKLVQKLKRGKQFHTCDEDDEVVALEELLLNVGYQYNQQWQSTVDATAPNVFFSYASEDGEIRAELEKQLVIWYSQLILPGQHRSQETIEALEKADIIIQLISADYIDSLEIMDGECARALEKPGSGEVHLIPIQVRPCLWDSAIPETIQILPRSENALSTFKDQDGILVEVAREIIEVINEVRKKKSSSKN